MIDCLFKGPKCLITKFTTVMSTVSSDDFGSLIAFVFVLHDNLIPSHDCLNPLRINWSCAKKTKAGNCLRP